MRQEIGRLANDGVGAPIVRDTDHDRFEIRFGDEAAVLTYHLKQDALSLTHTEVPPSQRRKGVGEALVRAALDFARSQRWTVKPSCPFVARFIGRHPDYADLVDPAFRRT